MFYIPAAILVIEHIKKIILRYPTVTVSQSSFYVFPLVLAEISVPG